MTTRRNVTTTKKPKTAVGSRSGGRLQAAIDATVRREIEAALTENEGNVTQAAKALGISLRGLWKRLTTLGIDPARYRR